MFITVVEGQSIPIKKSTKVKLSIEQQSYTTASASDKEHPVWGEEFVL